MATIEEDYVSFETSKLLKEKGFPLPSTNFEDWAFCMYDENGDIKWGCYHPDYYARVTLQMAMKWLREVHSLYIWIGHAAGKVLSWYYEIHGISDGKVKHIGGIQCGSYEVACETAIKYCLENLI